MGLILNFIRSIVKCLKEEKNLGHLVVILVVGFLLHRHQGSPEMIIQLLDPHIQCKYTNHFFILGIRYLPITYYVLQNIVLIFFLLIII